MFKLTAAFYDHRSPLFHRVRRSPPATFAIQPAHAPKGSPPRSKPERRQSFCKPRLRLSAGILRFFRFRINAIPIDPHCHSRNLLQHSRIEGKMRQHSVEPLREVHQGLQK